MFDSPEAVLKGWMDRVRRGDIEGLLALYADGAVLVPTFSNRLLNTPDKIRGYFENLLQREKLSIALHEKALAAQPLQGALHTLCGIYCWRFAVEGELLSFEARFSLIVDLSAPSPILQHHSSQVPRSL